MKQCNHCKELKDLSLFNKSMHSKDGHERACKKCVYERKRAWELREALKAPWIKSFWSIRIRCRYTNTEKNRYYKNVPVNITLEEIKNLWFRDKAYEMKKPNIDRIDSKLGYSFENCQFLEASSHSVKTNKERKSMCLSIGKHYGGGRRPKNSDNREKEGAV